MSYIKSRNSQNLLLHLSVNALMASILTPIFRLGGVQCKGMPKKLPYDSRLHNSQAPYSYGHSFVEVDTLFT
jgi:hypothetical protein